MSRGVQKAAEEAGRQAARRGVSRNLNPGDLDSRGAWDRGYSEERKKLMSEYWQFVNSTPGFRRFLAERQIGKDAEAAPLLAEAFRAGQEAIRHEIIKRTAHFPGLF